MIHTTSSTPGKPARVLVVMGSVRAGRRCPQIAAWVIGIAETSGGLSYELLDLADWSLPMNDEPGIPAGADDYAHPHTRAWSAKIASADAFIFVTPQYNWGYPAPLKNAIDHLYKEWAGKPAVIVSYGGHGGDKCAAQLRQVVEAVHMRPVATMPHIRLSREMIAGGPINPVADFAAETESVHQAMRELAIDLEGRSPERADRG